MPSKTGTAHTETAAPFGVDGTAVLAHPGDREQSDRTPFEDREERLFQSLDIDNDKFVLLSDFEAALEEVGISPGDYRLRESMVALRQAAHRKDPNAPAWRKSGEQPIPAAQFIQAIRHNILLIERILQGRLIIPDFTAFRYTVEEIFRQTKKVRSGSAADYIPQLNLKGVELDRFGVSICTIDGQRFSTGDADSYFTVQSTCKPILYALALETLGENAVHRYVGHEPSGARFNELKLNAANQPHNPMINAGAIMSSALIHQSVGTADDESRSQVPRGAAGARFDYVMEQWKTLCGGERPRFNNSVYLSERETADRNFALAYFMRENRAFPEGTDLHDILDFYFQCCAIELNTDMMSVIAATLANGGICPATGRRVFGTKTVQHCLSLMATCGMYDFSGEFAFTIGLPAKSGVSGAMMIVVPNVMGICTWSPRLDENGNSVRGIEFCRHIVDTFSIHNFDNLAGASGKNDPRSSQIEHRAATINDLIWAARKGDLGALQNRLLRGGEINCADYDRRTPLHLAAAENQVEVVQFIIDQNKSGRLQAELNVRDRWGGTPLDDAHLQGHTVMAKLLEKAGATNGSNDMLTRGTSRSVAASLQGENPSSGEMIWAASAGDLTWIRRLVARGVPLDVPDYDLRTPLHLASAEGHAAVVRYLLAHHAEPNPRDRWDNTPLDDATREGHREVADILIEFGGKSDSREPSAAH